MLPLLTRRAFHIFVAAEPPAHDQGRISRNAIISSTGAGFKHFSHANQIEYLFVDFRLLCNLVFNLCNIFQGINSNHTCPGTSGTRLEMEMWFHVQRQTYLTFWRNFRLQPFEIIMQSGSFRWLHHSSPISLQSNSFAMLTVLPLFNSFKKTCIPGDPLPYGEAVSFL